jgi:hypothetical protein
MGGTGRVGGILAFPPVRIIGDISYSLYLVHWPIIVFYRYVTEADLTGTEQFCLVVASIILGFALHFGVEKPMRQPEFWRRGRVALAPVVFCRCGADCCQRMGYQRMGVASSRGDAPSHGERQWCDRHRSQNAQIQD